MNKATEETILELYDEAYHKGKQIKSLSKMFHISEDEIREVLVKNGRKLPNMVKQEGKMTAGLEAQIRAGKKKPEKVAKEEGEEKKDISEAMGVLKAAGKTEEECKEEVLKAAKEAAAVKSEAAGRILPMPDIIKDIISKELDKIDDEIAYHQRELTRLQTNYNAIADYIR